MSTARYMVKAFMSVVMEEPSQTRDKKLASFLGNLTGHEARGLLALVRVGENGVPQFDEALQRVTQDHEKKTGIIAEISNKKFLAAHLAAGLELAMENDVDLDSYFRIRSQSQRRRMALDAETS